MFKIHDISIKFYVIITFNIFWFIIQAAKLGYPFIQYSFFKWVVNILSFPYTFIGICALLHGPSFEIKLQISFGLLELPECPTSTTTLLLYAFSVFLRCLSKLSLAVTKLNLRLVLI